MGTSGSFHDVKIGGFYGLMNPKLGWGPFWGRRSVLEWGSFWGWVVSGYQNGDVWVFPPCKIWVVLCFKDPRLGWSPLEGSFGGWGPLEGSFGGGISLGWVLLRSFWDWIPLGQTLSGHQNGDVWVLPPCKIWVVLCFKDPRLGLCSLDGSFGGWGPLEGSFGGWVSLGWVLLGSFWDWIPLGQMLSGHQNGDIRVFPRCKIWVVLCFKDPKLGWGPLGGSFGGKVSLGWVFLGSFWGWIPLGQTLSAHTKRCHSGVSTPPNCSGCNGFSQSPPPQKAPFSPRFTTPP